MSAANEALGNLTQNHHSSFRAGARRPGLPPRACPKRGDNILPIRNPGLRCAPPGLDYSAPSGLSNDGNLTNDSLWSYTWDAENRLLAMESKLASLPSTNLAKRVEFSYDWQGRRIRKLVKNSSLQVLSDTRFIYDGWNLVAELNSDLSLKTSYAWGLDLSGSIQGAGGVGGLLFAVYYSPSTEVYFPAYDGNGNLMALCKGSDGTWAAQYEYGPFGEVIRATGPMARVNPFRWSTQYTDDETDLLMYPARPYSPSTGRFLSRDRIEEEGGLNLYGFVENAPVNFVDPFGEEILVIAGRHKFNGTTFPLESVQSNWGIKHFANQVRRAFQEIVGDCAKLELADAGTDRISVPTSSGTKTLERKRFRITFSGEKASCKCNDCWQLLKRAIQDTGADIEIRFLVDRDNAAYMPPDDSVYINPGVNVPLFEQSPKGGYRKKPVPFPIVLWHEGIGHDYQGFGHPDIPANRTPTWDGVYMDPTIREENRARNCTRLAGERYGGFLGLFGRSLGDRIPTYYGNPNTPTYP